jgi:hypothetical protein
MAITDPKEMRKILNSVAFNDRIGLDGERLSPEETLSTSTLIWSTRNAAHFAGLSGEDHMTMLAYLALKELEAARKQIGKLLVGQPTVYVLPVGTELIK